MMTEFAMGLNNLIDEHKEFVCIINYNYIIYPYIYQIECIVNDKHRIAQHTILKLMRLGKTTLS